MKQDVNDLARARMRTVKYDPERLALEQKMTVFNTWWLYLDSRMMKVMYFKAVGRMSFNYDQQASERVLASLEASLGTTMK